MYRSIRKVPKSKRVKCSGLFGHLIDLSGLSIVRQSEHPEKRMFERDNGETLHPVE